MTLVADATDATDVKRVVGTAMERFGRIDVLHNNVGATIIGDPIDMSEADWRRSIDINLTSAFLTCKNVLPLMLRQGSGAIVNVSSLASIQVNAYPYFGYLTAKAGLNQLTRAIAVRYASSGIRANAVLPGVIDTPLVEQQLGGQFADAGEMRQKRNAASPMGRMGDAWDVAYASLFLASDEAKYITGVCLPVDGGKSCWGDSSKIGIVRTTAKHTGGLSDALNLSESALKVALMALSRCWSLTATHWAICDLRQQRSVPSIAETLGLGCSPKARQIRCAVDGARLQWVAPLGRVSSVLRMVLAISSSPISRGAPGRGSS